MSILAMRLGVSAADMAHRHFLLDLIRRNRLMCVLNASGRGRSARATRFVVSHVS